MSTQSIKNVVELQQDKVASRNEFAFNTELNVEFLEKSYRENLEFGKKMFSIFLSTIESDLEKLAASIEDNDYDGIKSIAHKVKNNFTWVGLPRMSSMMYKIETSSSNKSVSVINEYNEFLKIFKQDFDLVKTEHKRLSDFLA